MDIKKTEASSTLPLQYVGDGFTGANLDHQLGNLDPFLILSEFYMDKAFFPPHPHAGFSVMTYMFTDSPGSFINRDSLGDHSRIAPGAIHWTQAGIGIQHEEIPELEGQMCHGLQMWVNHASKDRYATPKSWNIPADEVPAVALENNSVVRVLVGNYQEVKAAFTPLPEITLLDVHLTPHSTFTHAVPAGHVSFVLLMQGVAYAAGHKMERLTALKFAESGDTLVVNTQQEPASFLVATGLPFHEKTRFSGPYVMSTEEQIRQTKIRFGKGEMGILKPSPIFEKHK